MRTNMRKFGLALTVLTLVALLLAVFGAVSAAGPVDYYVRTDGDDNNDGSANDADNAWLTIQHAVSTVSSGDTINVAAGTYEEQVTIGKSLNLIGAGEATTTIKAPTSGRSTVSQPNSGYSDIVWDYVVAAYPSSGTIDVKIEGFTIDANGQEGSSSQNFAGVFLRDIGDGSGDGLYSCTVNNFGSYGASSNYWSGTYGTWMGNYGVVIYDDSELTVDDNDLDDYTVSGISAKGTSVNLTITSNDLDGTDSNYVGLFLRDGVATISGNNIHDHDGVGENMGIYLYDAATGVTVESSNTIEDNYIGLFLKGTDGATIDGNTFTDNTYRSIVMQQDSDSNVVTDNTITMTSASVMNAIYIGSDSGDNVIGGATAADGNTITIPTNTTHAAHLPYVIHFATGGSNDATIQNNTINNGARAIQIDGGNTGTYTIADNTITNDGTNSINMNYAVGMNAGNAVITGNTMTGTRRPLEYGCGGGGTITFTGNTVSGSNFFGVNLNCYSGNPDVTGNAFLDFGGNGNVVWNQGAGAVDATTNWWGDTDPSDNVNNSGSGSIDYSPWWGANYVGDNHSSAWTWYTDDSIQDAINAASSGDTINVAAGTYSERLTINKSLSLRGAQYGVDPTAAGARTNPADESIITEAGLSTPNPDVLIEIPNGITNVTIDGFTLNGDPTNPVADTSVIRCGGSSGTANNISIKNNIVDGFKGILFKNGDTLTVDRNRMIVNKNGVVLQFSATNLTSSNNAFSLGTSPAGDESAMYLTSCTDCDITGNTATGFTNGKGVAGSNLTNITVSGNTFTGNKDAVSFWGSTTFITITTNVLTDSVRYGVSIKGQDVNITENKITDNGDVGINIDKDTIDTERVAIYNNDLSGNTNYGLQVSGAVAETVDASSNWWGINTPAGVAAEVSGSVDYTPWLASGTDTSGDPGFQGDFSELWVDDDGEQTGTTGRIQEGINEVTASTVNVASGTYTENVVINKSLDLIGVISTTTTIDGNDVGNTVTITASDVTISGFTVTGGWANGEDVFYPYGGVVVDGNDGASALTGITIEDNIIDGNSGNGVYVSAAGDGGVANNVVIKDCQISNNGGSDNFAGISLTHPNYIVRDVGVWDEWRRPKNILVQGNTVYSNSSYGVYVSAGEDNVIRSNTIRDNLKYGIQLASSWNRTDIPCEYTTVENNDIYDNVRNGVKLTSYNQHNTFTGNTIWDNGYGGTSDRYKYGFLFQDGNDNTIQNNTITGNALGGLYLWGKGDPTYTWYSTTDNTITGNTISAHTAAGGHGIYIPANYGYPNSGFLNSQISSNSITNNEAYGLENADATQIVDAEDNWWGAASGPGPEGPGSGDDVSTNVDYSPWWGDDTGSFTVEENASGELEVSVSADAADVQSLIDSVPSGTIIVLPDVTYYPSGGFTISTSGITIKLSDGTVIQASSPCFKVNANNTTIEGGVCEPSDGDHGIRTEKAVNDLVIRDIEIRKTDPISSTGDGIHIGHDVTNLRIFDTYIHGLDGDGIEYASGVTVSGWHEVQGNLFQNNDGYGINNQTNSSFDVKYNSWDNIAGPTVGGTNGVTGTLEYAPWTHVALSMSSSGSPNTDEVAEGYQITYTVNMDAKEVYGADFDLDFNNTKLEVKSIITGTEFSQVGDCDVSTVSEANNDGYISFCGKRDSALDGLAKAVFTVTFQAKLDAGENTVNLNLDDTDDKFTMKPGYGPSTNIYASDLEDKTLTIYNATTVNGAIDLEGRPSNAGAVMTFGIGQDRHYGPFTFSTSGYWGDISADSVVYTDTYSITVSMARYLDVTSASNMSVTINSDGQELTKLVLVAGDANHDHVIDIGDVSLIGGVYGKTSSDFGWIENADINADDVIDISDLVLACGNYNKSSDASPPPTFTFAYAGWIP